MRSLLAFYFLTFFIVKIEGHKSLLFSICIAFVLSFKRTLKKKVVCNMCKTTFS